MLELLLILICNGKFIICLRGNLVVLRWDAVEPSLPK